MVAVRRLLVALALALLLGSFWAGRMGGYAAGVDDTAAAIAAMDTAHAALHTADLEACRLGIQEGGLHASWLADVLVALGAAPDRPVWDLAGL